MQITVDIPTYKIECDSEHIKNYVSTGDCIVVKPATRALRRPIYLEDAHFVDILVNEEIIITVTAEELEKAAEFCRRSGY